ncbi:hypothetical protein ACFX15_038133 [Malus domestica]
MVPPLTRLYRVRRDIPMPTVTSGVEKGNNKTLPNILDGSRTDITKLGRNKWSLFVVIIRHVKDEKHFFHMKILATIFSLGCCNLGLTSKTRPSGACAANEGWETFLSYEETRQVFLLYM